MLDLEQLLLRKMAFSHATYGPGPREEGIIDHITRETEELASAAPEDKHFEWVDIINLGFDGLCRLLSYPDGQNRVTSPEDVAAMVCKLIIAKQGIIEARTYPDWRTAPYTQAIQHTSAPTQPDPTQPSAAAPNISATPEDRQDPVFEISRDRSAPMQEPIAPDAPVIEPQAIQKVPLAAPEEPSPLLPPGPITDAIVNHPPEQYMQPTPAQMAEHTQAQTASSSVQEVSVPAPDPAPDPAPAPTEPAVVEDHASSAVSQPVQPAPTQPAPTQPAPTSLTHAYHTPEQKQAMQEAGPPPAHLEPSEPLPVSPTHFEDQVTAANTETGTNLDVPVTKTIDIPDHQPDRPDVAAEHAASPQDFQAMIMAQLNPSS